jgi:hypothetical protein
VGTRYEVEINATFVIGANLPTKDLTIDVSFSPFCDTPSVTNSTEIQICDGTSNISGWKGQLFNRPLNSPSKMGAVLVINGSSFIKTEDRTYVPSIGDEIEIYGSALRGANAARVLAISASGSQWTIKLDRPVAGGVGTPDASNMICLTGESRPSVIANLTFQAECGCGILANFAAIPLSSQSAFPQGRIVEGENNCVKQEYCFEITNGPKVALRGVIAL